VFEIFFPWIRGSTLVSCDRGRLLGDLPGTITSLNIDAAELTPSVAASLVRRRENVPTLKTLLTIGEMLNSQVIHEFGGSDTKPSMLFGMYGPTEAAIHCTLQPSFATHMPAGTIGIPLDTVSCFIVRPAESAKTACDIDILPLGEVGELAVGGHQLALGYLNREEQTRAAFVPHPEYGSLYRTGDKARLLPDGILECQGRISSGQVKLRGQRIELGEIEHAASKVPGCHAVVASVISGQLVVFCIVGQGAVTVDTVKQACGRWLPKYMVPSDVVLLSDFPYLPSGKVDKRKLENDYTSHTSQSNEDTQDMSDDLKKVVKLLSSVLHTDVDPSADLGSMGLDSLKAIQVASEFRREGIAQVGALDLLACGNARDMAAAIEKPLSKQDPSVTTLKSKLLEELHASVTKDTELGQQARHLQDVLPCTPLQDAMLAETARNPQAYCNSFELSLPSGIALPRIRQCLDQLASTHSLLRSGFCVSRTSISAYTQLTWTFLDEPQIKTVTEFDHGFSVPQATALLRPVRFQLRETSDRVNVLVQMHHALYDQWSVEVLIDDMNTLLSGDDISSRPSFRSVNEFFLEMKLSPDSQSDSVSFWQDYLSGSVPGHLPRLHGEIVPPASLAVANHTMEFDISTVRKCAQQKACSPHVFFQAVYAYLLSLYMGAADVTFGTVYSGRTLPIGDVENMFGPILSTLPTRVDLSGARKFSDVLRRLQEDNRNIMQHSSLSLAEIRRASSVSSGQALFDSIFVWQETARTPLPGQGLVELCETTDQLEFNLTLELEPSENGLRAKATYQPSLLGSDVVETMMCQLEQITKLVLEDPEAPLHDLTQSLSPALLSTSNPEPQNFVFNRNLGSVVEKHAQETPEKAALCFADNIDIGHTTAESLSYDELNARANRLAHFLISLGTVPDELVCICMEKSVNLYIGILAIAKTGAGYLPLVPETPSFRIGQIISDAQVRVCLSDSGTSNVISDLDLCRSIDISSADYSDHPSSNPEVPFDPSHSAYAIFTSGTTGKPKGVLITQENILSNLAVLERIYPTPNNSRLLQACNQAFDVSVFEIFFAWYSGMCLCSATKDILFRDMENAINQLEITHLSFTPTVATLVDPTNVPRVKFLVTAGEALTHQVHKAWAGKGLYNGYGPSEVTNICTVNPKVLPAHAINNIGMSFENTSAFVLANDPRLQILPCGALGELCFGGQQVFRGYQNMEDLTASKIINHEDYGRIYRSGDLGRMLPDGTILIEGRIDDQRKLRGQRIELEEITSLLLRQSTVRDCYVQIIGDDKQLERLVAFWIPRKKASQNYSIIKSDSDTRDLTNSLFNTLADELPAYMIPSCLIPVTVLPRTAQGKIDRRQLTSDLSHLTSDMINSFSPVFEEDSEGEVLSSTEIALVAALAEVLQLPQSSITRTMSFYALGLDSVSAIRLSRSIKTALGTQVDVSVILKRPNIMRLAAAIDERLSESQAIAKSNESSSGFLSKETRSAVDNDFLKRGRDVQGILPCTPLQEAMLSASSGGASEAYYNHTIFKISGDVPRLRESWQVMLRRHAILRTAFTATDDPKFPYLQIVLRGVNLPWSECKLTSDIESPDQLIQSASSDQNTAVLNSDPPFKLKVINTVKDSYLLLEMHHAMYDGNAMLNLLHEVEETYRGASLPPAPEFAPFLDYMLSMDLGAADAFFGSHLQGYTPKPFPRATRDDRGQGFGLVEVKLPVSRARVQDFLRRHTVSMIGLIQAVWAKVLSISQGHSDICFGNVVSGRSAPVDGVQSLVAPCFNTIPVRIDLSKVRSNLALVKALQKTNVDSIPYQLTPLRRTQAKAGIAATRLFDSMVLLQQEPTTLDTSIWSILSETGDMNVCKTPSQSGGPRHADIRTVPLYC